MRWQGEGGLGEVGTVQMQTQWQGVNPVGSVQLAAPRPLSMGFTGLKQRDKIWSVVWVGIKPGPHFSLKPHEHKLAENKVTTGKQPSSKASNIPLWSQKRWKLYFWRYKNSQDSLRSRPLAFQGFSKIVNVFLPPWFSYLGRPVETKKVIVFVFLYQYTVLLEHPSLGMIEFVALSGVSRVFLLVSFWLKKYLRPHLSSKPNPGLFGAASRSNHSIHL